MNALLYLVLATPLFPNTQPPEIGGSTSIGLDDDTALDLGSPWRYRFIYNSTANQFELWTTDSDGAAADAVALSLDDGDLILDFAGAATVAGTVTSTGFVIGANALDANEWANLDGQDQAVAAASTPTFGGLTLNGNLDVQANSIIVGGGLLFDDSDQLDLGSSACTDSHSQGAGDTCVVGTLQVKGVLWPDSGVTLGATETLTESGAVLVSKAGQGFRSEFTADMASANRALIRASGTGSKEFIGSSGTQYGIWNTPHINQSGTAAFEAIGGDITDTQSGSGQDYWLNLKWATVPVFQVQDDGDTMIAGALTLAQAPVFADYTRHHDVPIGAAIVGAAAPGQETIGTFRCYVFDANADLAYINVEVPSEWNETSDMAIDLLIFTDDGDALGNGEVIEFDLVYRPVAVGEAYDYGHAGGDGNAVTINATVTGGGAEVDKGHYKISATVDYNHAQQPLAVNDTLGFSIMRDVSDSDTYSGDVHVCRAQLVYSAHALATH